MAAEEDPWGGGQVQDHMKVLLEEELEPVVVLDEDDAIGNEDVSEIVEAKIRKSVGGFIADLRNGAAVRASGCGLTQFPMSSFTRSYLVQLDLSSNKLDLAQVNALGAGGCWLRQLSVANNNLTEYPSLPNCPKLIMLDISDNDFETLHGFPTEDLEGLVSLDISGCSLASLLGDGGDCPLKGLAALSVLNIGSNDLEEVEDLAPLKAMRSVTKLDVEDNPCAEEHRCKAYIAKAMPWLQRLNNQGLKTTIKAASCGGVAHTSGNIETILEFNKDSSSCSCLEGDACVAPEGCRDWKDRYKVAKAVRRSMGLLKEDD